MTNRIHGLDILRSAAIILVFMFHYTDTTKQDAFGFIGGFGWAGVDLFFVLSGYLIGNQIFSTFVNSKKLSLSNFYSRRFLRTLPNYFAVLCLYFTLPNLREIPEISPLWKFLSFTLNFGLNHSAFSHAWSLCIEEQFYLFMPLIALFIFYKGSIRTAWFTLFAILLGGIILRSMLWFTYIHHAGDQMINNYIRYIYYPSFSRLDPLLMGISLAVLKNFHKNIWGRITEKGNLFLILGLIGLLVSFYTFQIGNGFRNYSILIYRLDFFPTAFGYPILAISFAALTLSALSPKSWLYNMYIPGTMTLATWSYAFYLVHKSLIAIVENQLIKFHIRNQSLLAMLITIITCLAGSWLLYRVIEKPSLSLRNRFFPK